MKYGSELPEGEEGEGEGEGKGEREGLSEATDGSISSVGCASCLQFQQR